MVFVIIITFNGELFIKRCLESVYNSEASVQVVVVDNNSTDSTISIIESSFNKVKIIKNNTNIGFGRANNIGLNYALNKGGEYFLLLNQDAYLQNNSIENLLLKLNNNPKYGIISPIHLDGEGNQIDVYFQSFIAPPKCKNLYSDMFLKKKLKEIYTVEFINAAIWILSKNTIKMVGGFNPYFFHYAEDNDYVNRCKFKGLLVGIDPESYAYHDRIQKERKVTDKISHNLQDIKLMNPNNNITSSKMLNITFRKMIKSILSLNSSSFVSNFKYFIKTFKNKNKIDNIISVSKNDEYAFLNFKD